MLMRWIPLLILAYLVVLVQTTLVRFVTFTTPTLGSIGPDLTALVAVFVAFYARGAAETMLAAWCLGLAVDLTAAGGVAGATVVGPMAIAYSLAGGLLYRIREAFFRERALTQAMLAWAFCLLTHGLWVTAQTFQAGENVSLSAYGRTLGQAAAVATYSAALMPLVHAALNPCRRWFLVAPAGPGTRRR